MAEANMNNRFDFCSNGKVVYKGTQFTEYEDVEDAEEVINPYGDLWGAVCAAVEQVVNIHPFMQILVRNTQYMGIVLINSVLAALPLALIPGGPAGMAGRGTLVLTGSSTLAGGTLLAMGIPKVQVIDPNIVFAESGSGGSSKKDTETKETSKGDRPTRDQVDKLVNDIGGSVKNNPLRQEYESAVSNLKTMEAKLRGQGLSEESIARELSQARRDLGIKYKELTPPELREYIYEVNTGRYKDQLGPKFEDLVKRYDGDYSKIIEAAQRPNPDVDKLLGGFKEWLLKKNGL